MRIFSHAKRPVHLSAFPLERLRRAAVGEDTIRALKEMPADHELPAGNVLAQVCREYCQIYERFRNGAVATEKAPYFEDLSARTNELKSMALFFDATLVGASAIPPIAWLYGPLHHHVCAIVLAVEYNDHVEADNPVHDLIRGSDGAVAKMRATEVAAIISAYIRQLGFAAVAHAPHQTEISLAAMAVQAGIARLEAGKLVAPRYRTQVRGRCRHHRHGAGGGYAACSAPAPGRRRRLVARCGRNADVVGAPAVPAPSGRVGQIPHGDRQAR
jgi:hypothetical protein